MTQDASGNKSKLFDYDGDGKSDFSIYRPEVGEWWYLQSSTGGNAAAQFGTSTEKPVPADYTDDGKADMALYDPVINDWCIERSENQTSYVVRFGTSGDIPTPADYDGGDGKTDLAIYRLSTGYWWYAASAMNGQHRTGRFGISTDIPLPSAYVR